MPAAADGSGPTSSRVTAGTSCASARTTSTRAASSDCSSTARRARPWRCVLQRQPEGLGPMKRSDALAPLSRDHQHGLAVALQLRRATPQSAEAAREAFAFWAVEDPRGCPRFQPRARWSRSGPRGRSRAASPPSAHPRAERCHVSRGHSVRGRVACLGGPRDALPTYPGGRCQRDELALPPWRGRSRSRPGPMRRRRGERAGPEPCPRSPRSLRAPMGPRRRFARWVDSATVQASRTRALSGALPGRRAGRDLLQGRPPTSSSPPSIALRRPTGGSSQARASPSGAVVGADRSSNGG